MDVIGFRRLRTISQFTFESIPQIILQTHIYFYFSKYPEENDVDVNLQAIMFSILTAIAHVLMEILFVKMEREANKTTTMNYLMICFNGRFGFIPFTEYLDNQ